MTPGRIVRWLAALVLGIVVGMLAVLLLQRPPEPATQPTLTTASVSSTIASASSTTADQLAPTTLPVSPSLFVIWTPGGLVEGLAEGVGSLAGVGAVSEVRSDLILLDAVYDASGAVVEDTDAGWYVPIEAAAVDKTFSDLAPGDWQSDLAGLAPGEAVMSQTSATNRGVGAGATVVTRGTSYIVAVVPDATVGGAELVVGQEESESLGIHTPRYLLVDFEGDRALFEQGVRALLPREDPVRIRALGETPFLRHGDAVLPQALIKEAFGEFTVRPLPSGDVEFDQAWAGTHIATATYPLIGTASCHVGIASALRGALEELERNNLGSLIESFDGCFNPRFIAGSQLLSRHAWGVAIDLNYEANPTGQVTVQDPRLVATMERWGFTWGGNWLVPDAAHFEWIGPPKP